MLTPPGAGRLFLNLGGFSVIVGPVKSGKIKKLAAWTAGCLIVLMVATAVVLWLAPPALLRVGANYSAKIACSNVFIADRDPAAILREDLQAPGIWLMRWMRVAVDRSHGVARAGLLGFIGDGLAVWRPGEGCAAIPDGRLDAALRSRKVPAAIAAAAAPAIPAAPPIDSRDWPAGDGIDADEAVERVLRDDGLAGPGVRAVAVAYRGHLVAERYGDDFKATTPLLGWSMTKTVTAGLIGLLVKDGLLRLEDSAGWADDPGDRRVRIKVADLLSMTSGLSFNEEYGAVTDVTAMLYLEPDMAAYARAQALAHPVGAHWSYSSGTAVILAGIAADKLHGRAPAYLRERLFEPLGMRSAVMETDEHGTLVGSSYMYATARDWLRYAQLLLQGGAWDGREILPHDYVTMMSKPVPASDGRYGQGMVWLVEDAATAHDLPADTYWMLGHDGQSIAIVPSRGLAVLRMGLTPNATHYQPEPLLRAVLAALGTP